MKENFTYTAPYSEAHISADLSAMAMLFIEMMCEQQEQNKPYGELIATKDALAQFGFTNSQNAKLLGEMTAQMDVYKKASEVLSFMEDVWKKFGKDAMVVRYDHFFQILEKYDMVCGSFDRYTGAIPQSVLDMLTHLNGMWKSKTLGEKFVTPYKWGSNFEFVSENSMVEKLTAFMRMPLNTTEHIKTLINDAIGISGGILDLDDLDDAPCATSLSDVLFIAAPAADMKPLSIRIGFRTEKISSLRRNGLSWYGLDIETKRAIRQEEDRLKSIIAASDINRYAQISFIDKVAEVSRLLRDPFICSLTPHGVLIHAKWGPEAEDATIKRYEQLRDAVIGKGGAV